MEQLFRRHTSQTTPSDPAWDQPSQAVKLTSVSSLGHPKGLDEAGGDSTSHRAPTVAIKHHPWAWSAQNSILEMQNKFFMAQKPQ